MSGVTRVFGSVLSFVVLSVLLSPVLAFGADATLVQQIGDLSSEVADAVAEEVSVVPVSSDIDARTTPIIVAPGKAFVVRGRPGQVAGLSGAERQAIRQAYDAGQTILLLHASMHYLVNTGGDWTATDAAWTSASTETNPTEITNPNNQGNLSINYQAGTEFCGAGFPVSRAFEAVEAAEGFERICVYIPYPLWYEVDIVPPAGPTVKQVNAAPAGDQGQSASYSSRLQLQYRG
jgi:hypothetical protein